MTIRTAWSLPLLLLCLETATGAPNLMPNGSFEEGGAGWTLWKEIPNESQGAVIHEGARRGGHCYKVTNRGHGGSNLYSDPVPVAPGVRYTLSVYVRTRQASHVAVAAWGIDADGETISYAIGGETAVPDELPNWGRFEKTFFAPDDCVAVKAHLICNGGEAWWDGVMLEAASEMSPWREGPSIHGPKMPAGNLLTNSSFEQGEEGWTLWRENPDESSGGPQVGSAFRGKMAFHVINRGAGGANLFSEGVPCKPNTSYTLSAYAKTKAGRNVRVAVWALAADGSTIKYGLDPVITLPRTTRDFQRFATTVVTPLNAVYLRAHLICNGGEVWWDCVQLEMGDDATDYRDGPKAAVEPASGREAAVGYARAIIREARLQDVLSQARRLVAYQPSGTPGLAEAQKALAAATLRVKRVFRGLEGPYRVPDYEHFDYEHINNLISDAQAALVAVWNALHVTPAPSFEAWRPKIPPHVDKRWLANELVIFPCFTRDYFFQGEGDWDILKPFGFRIVSGWWSASGSASGYNFANLDERIRICAEHGYKCDIAVTPAMASQWLFPNLGEEVFLHTADGRWSKSGNCHDTSNIWHPRVLKLGNDFLHAFGEHYRDNDAVAAYELVNEPSLTVERRAHGYEYKYLGPGGYSDQAKAAFRKWLKRQYGDIAALNARWRVDFASFDAVEPPIHMVPPAPTSEDEPVATGAIYDFQRFRSLSHANYFRDAIEALRSGDPERAISSQFISAPVSRKDSAVNLFEMATIPRWDLWGTHDWPGAGPGTACLFAYSMSRYAAAPLWEDEFIWSQWERRGTPEPVMRAATERNLWRQIAWGKRGISLFNLESEWLHDSPASWNNSMLNIEAERRVPRYSTGAIPMVERKANMLKDVLFRTEITNQELAILRPTSAILCAAPNGKANELAAKAGAYLLTRHWTPFYVPEEAISSGLEDLSRYKVIITPYAVCAPDSVQNRLLKWVKGGGHLVCLGPFGLFDPYGRPTRILLNACNVSARWKFNAQSGSWAAAPAAETIQKSLGAGRLTLIPAELSPENEEQLDAAIARSIPVQPVTTDAEGVQLTLRKDAGGTYYLFAVNLSARKAKKGMLRLAGRFEAPVELSIAGHPHMPVELDEEVTRIPLLLDPGKAILVRLGKMQPT